MNYKNTKYLLNQRPIGMPINDCWILDYDYITSILPGDIIIQNEYLLSKEREKEIRSTGFNKESENSKLRWDFCYGAGW